MDMRHVYDDVVLGGYDIVLDMLNVDYDVVLQGDDVVIDMWKVDVDVVWETIDVVTMSLGHVHVYIDVVPYACHVLYDISERIMGFP